MRFGRLVLTYLMMVELGVLAGGTGLVVPMGGKRSRSGMVCGSRGLLRHLGYSGCHILLNHCSKRGNGGPNAIAILRL